MASDMKDKTILITGATDGIGKVSAIELARQGAQVILVGRNEEKSAQTCRQIQKETNNSRVDYLLADLSVQADVRRLASEYRQRYDRLHVLINNAGAFFWRRKESADGLEMTLALNHLAYFLLTNLLLDRLLESAPARIINVSSNAHFGARARFEDVERRNGDYNGWGMYALSKLMNVLFTYELARRLEGSQVSANCLHPGFVATNFGKNNDGIVRPFISLAQLAAISPQKGAETILYLSTSPEVEGISGQYFYKKKAVRSSPASYSQEAARQLWQKSLAWCRLEKDPFSAGG